MTRLVACFIILLLAPAWARAAEIDRQHAALLERQIAALEPSRAGTTELYVLAAGLSSRQDVFRNDVQTVRDLFEQHWDAAGRSVSLIADFATKGESAYPTRSNLWWALQGIRRRMDPEKDVLLLFLASHGSPREPALELTVPNAKPAQIVAPELRRWLDEARIKWRVIVISACYSGAFIDELRDDHTLLIAAAHGTRMSFGCSYRFTHTWFTEAWVRGLMRVKSLERAFDAAAAAIERREEEETVPERSLPQIYVGPAIRAKLAELEARARPAVKWAPPIALTEMGRVRDLLGDYVATATVGGRPQVYRLRLDRVVSEFDGRFSIAGAFLQFYARNGPLSAQYVPATRKLSGTLGKLGELELAEQGGVLQGSLALAGEPALPLEFRKASPREVIEAAAAAPPPAKRAKRDSAIRLFYFSAGDCPFCRKWERDHIAGKRLLDMPEHAHLSLVTISRATLKEKVKRSDFPSELARLHDKFEATAGISRVLSVTPSFVLMVDDEVRIWTLGAFYDVPIYPMLRAAVKEKLAD